MKKVVLILLLMPLFGLNSFAQDPCVRVAHVIGEAEVHLVAGDYEEALKMLRACVDDPEVQDCSNLRVVKAKIKDIENRLQTGQSSEKKTENGITFVVKGVTFNMINVEGGTFKMGVDKGDYSSRKPAHQVTLSDYCIGETEVTQALWEAVMGSNPSPRKDANLPVGKVSWNDCQEFIKELNRLTGRQFRLPTEAEWEYAARGGSKGRDTKYAGSNDVGSVAWYATNSGDSRMSGELTSRKIKENNCRSHPVKSKMANELGLYDMSGNVQEWCHDWYGYYTSDAVTNPLGAPSGVGRVLRGGSYSFSNKGCEVYHRENETPDKQYNNIGFRLAL